jgi:hypothetical protein
MKKLSSAVAILFVCLASQGGHAQGPTAVKQIPGYTCMRLKVTHEQVQDRLFSVPIFSSPSIASPKLGQAGAIQIVKEPVVLSHPFQEVLFPDGRPGWIESKWLGPYATAQFPEAHCTPYIMSNGKPGFG